MMHTLVVLLSLAAPAAASPDVGVDLSSLDGWRIIIPGDAIASEQYAAQQFQLLLAEASGRTLSIVTKLGDAVGAIYIGSGPVMQRSHVGFTVDDLGEEDLRIVVRNDAIAIAGGGPRGTLYGVYTFFEDYVGVRFLTADHTHVPSIGTWHMCGPVDRIYRTPLRVRWNDVAENERDLEFAARLRCNAYRPVTNPAPSRSGSPDPKLGGITDWVLINHSFARQIPTRQYGQEHQEYFALRDGHRLAVVEADAWDSQPCTTNPQVLDVVTAAVFSEIEAQPHRGNFSVSQNDNQKYCLCKNCDSLDRQEGTQMGSLLSFVNAVAERVEERYHGKQIGTLAYQYSRKPPRSVRPRENVQIQLATIECSLIQPINDPDSKLNRAFCEDYEAWASVTDNIYIWSYNTNFHHYLLPVPNLWSIGSNIRFFVAAGVSGVYFEDAHDPGSSFSDLRNYVTSRLLWNPALDDKSLVDEFIRLHYGTAAEPVRRYVELLHDNATSRRIEHNCFGAAADYGIDDSIIQAGLEAFDQALVAAEDPVTRARVEKASIAAYAAAIDGVWQAVRAGDAVQSLDPQTLKDARPYLQILFGLCRRHGVPKLDHHTTVDEFEQACRELYGDMP